MSRGAREYQRQIVENPNQIFGSNIRLFDRCDIGLSKTSGPPDLINQISYIGPNLVGTLTARPEYSLAETSTKQSAKFDGINDFLNIAGDISTTAENYLIWTAIKPTSVAATPPKAIIDAYNGVDRLAIMLTDGPETGQVAYFDGSWRTFGLATLDPQFLAFYLIEGTGTSKVLRNNVQIGANSDYVKRPIKRGTESNSIGSLFNGGAWFLPAYIGEIGVAINPTNDQLVKLHTYARNWYPGIAIA